MPSQAAANAGRAGASAPLRFERILLVLILVLGAALRLTGLGAGLWYDEIATLVRYVRLPLGEIVTKFDTQNQHMLYSVLAHGTVRLFGESAWALRLPAAAFGVASLWAVWWLGVQMTARREALLAAALLAVSYHHVWFSQDARGYSMLLFWSLVGTGLFLRLLERAEPGRGLVAAYALVMALACWTQVAGAFVVAGHGLVWLTVAAVARRMPKGAAWSPLAAMALAGALSVLLYAPVLPAMTHTLAGPKATGGAAEWKSPLWFAAEAARGLARGAPGGWAGLIAGVAVVLAGVTSFWQRSRTVALLLVLPGVVTGAAVLATAHNLWPRLFFFSAGFAALIAVRGGFRVCEALFGARAGAVATMGALAVCAVSAFTVPRAWAPKQDYGAALAFVNTERPLGEAMLTVDMTRLPYRDFYRMPWTAADSVGDLRAGETQAGRAWLLYTFPERLAAVDSAIWNRLRCCYTEVRRFPGTVQGGTIVVMRSR